VFCIVLILLPIGVSGIGFLSDLVLLQRSKQHIKTSMYAASVCLSENLLSIGKLGLDIPLATSKIRKEFLDELPAALTGRLTLISVKIVFRPVIYDPSHWQGENQPGYLPVIRIRAGFLDRSGQLIVLEDAIEYLLD
jgi:hypothetical protein